MWCIPKMTPEYVECMYDVLDLYEQPYDPKRPVVGVDEKLKVLIGEKKNPILMKPGSPEKYDYEYTKNGTANIFVAIDFKGGKRVVQVTDRRTKKDFARFARKLVDKGFKDADIIRLVCDNLNTHNESSFYEAFDKSEARRILKKIEFHYTPKHASWLDVAETEIGVLEAQCIDRRIASKNILRQEVYAWARRRNKEKKKINWKFTREDADKKLSKHYIKDDKVKKFKSTYIRKN